MASDGIPKCFLIFRTASAYFHQWRTRGQKCFALKLPGHLMFISLGRNKLMLWFNECSIIKPATIGKLRTTTWSWGGRLDLTRGLDPEVPNPLWAHLPLNLLTWFRVQIEKGFLCIHSLNSSHSSFAAPAWIDWIQAAAARETFPPLQLVLSKFNASYCCHTEQQKKVPNF